MKTKYWLLLTGYYALTTPLYAEQPQLSARLQIVRQDSVAHHQSVLADSEVNVDMEARLYVDGVFVTPQPVNRGGDSL